MKIILDLETVSAADLKEVGSRNYAKHKTTQISVMCWKVLNQDKVYRLVHPRLTSDPVCQESLKAAKRITNSRIIAHNANFECDLLNAQFDNFLAEFGVKIKPGHTLPPGRFS